MESDATPHCPVGSVSSGISMVMTSSGDRVADMDAEQAEKVGSVAARRTNENPRK